METKVKSELEAIIAGRNLPEGHHYQSLGDIVYAVRNYGEQLDAGATHLPVGRGNDG